MKKKSISIIEYIKRDDECRDKTIDDIYIECWGKIIAYEQRKKIQACVACSTYSDYHTEKQWNDKGYIVDYPTPDHARGHTMWTNAFCNHKAKYFNKAEVREMTAEEKIAYKEEKRLRAEERAIERERERKKLEEEWLKKYERKKSAHTSWQWLYYYNCKVKEGELPHESDFGWWYYYPEQVEPVTDIEYDKLKELYISIYGGWTTIDLDNTAYNGKKWY